MCLPACLTQDRATVLSRPVVAINESASVGNGVVRGRSWGSIGPNAEYAATWWRGALAAFVMRSEKDCGEPVLQL